MKKIILICLTCFIYSSLDAHPWKSDYYVVIDTDCGIDDIRAINMLLASSSVRVLGIIASDGVRDAKTGYNYINHLLKNYYKEGILTGINDFDIIDRTPKHARLPEFNQDIKTEGKAPATHIQLMTQILSGTRENIIFISLGSLNTVSSILDSIPLAQHRIKKIIWPAHCDKPEAGYNYKLDEQSYHRVMNSSISINLIDGKDYYYSDSLIDNIKSIPNEYAEDIVSSFSLHESPFAKRCYDELVVLFLHYDTVFVTSDNQEKTKQCYTLTNTDYLMKFEDILSNSVSTKTQVLANFPVNENDYFEDVRDNLSNARIKYGQEEWSACVLTSELHRHLGIYALVGAKMGIRAKEYFGAGIDELEIISYAGLVPPFSCMNDGLQVSTGATLGHGLISVSDDSSRLPKAEFTYLGQTITVSLKEEYRKKIESEVKELQHIYTLDSNIYWELIRKLALSYWNIWDRHEIFEITVK